jgi:hypothetical protein
VCSRSFPTSSRNNVEWIWVGFQKEFDAAKTELTSVETPLAAKTDELSSLDAMIRENGDELHALQATITGEIVYLAELVQAVEGKRHELVSIENAILHGLPALGSTAASPATASKRWRLFSCGLTVRIIFDRVG